MPPTMPGISMPTPPVTFTSELPQQPAARPTAPPEGYFTLDEKSLATVRKLQERFNLSTPHEALRMLLAIGTEHISRWD